MSIYMYLLFAHLIGDFVFQSDFIAKFKKDNIFIMVVHVLLYSLSISVVLNMYGLYDNGVFGLLCATHFLIDIVKCYQATPENAMGKWLYIDQASHIAVIILILVCKGAFN